MSLNIFSSFGFNNIFPPLSFGYLVLLCLGTQIFFGFFFFIFFVCDFSSWSHFYSSLSPEVCYNLLIRLVCANCVSLLFFGFFVHVRRGLKFGFFHFFEMWVVGSSLLLPIMVIPSLLFFLSSSDLFYWFGFIVAKFLYYISYGGDCVLSWIGGSFSMGNLTLSCFSCSKLGGVLALYVFISIFYFMFACFSFFIFNAGILQVLPSVLFRLFVALSIVCSWQDLQGILPVAGILCYPIPLSGEFQGALHMMGVGTNELGVATLGAGVLNPPNIAPNQPFSWRNKWIIIGVTVVVGVGVITTVGCLGWYNGGFVQTVAEAGINHFNNRDV